MGDGTKSGLRYPTTRLWSREPDTWAPRNGKTIDTIVVHYTATANLARVSNPARGLLLAKRAKARGWCEPKHIDLLIQRFVAGDSCSDAAALCMIAATLDRRASWHYCVASKPEMSHWTSCEVVEFVPTIMQAHHIGALGLKTNLRSIGIECVYPGSISQRKTREQAEEFYRFAGWTGAVWKLPGPDGVKRWYVQPDDEQVETLTALVIALCRQWKTISAICSHYTFAPTKRTDPDPPFDLVNLRELVSKAVSRPMAAKPPARSVT